MEQEIKERLSFLGSHRNWIIFILLIAIIIYGGVCIRTLNLSGLRDVSTGTWTLAPDLDPFLFLRWAKDIASPNGLPAIDTMRCVPQGFDTARELTLPSYLIVYLWKFLNLFSPVSIEYSAIIYPVIFFCLALIFAFLFVRKAFSNYKNSDIIALISTAFIAVIPGLVHRTVAGVPEKEAAGIFFMFFIFYIFACALKEDKNWKATLLGLLAGAATGIMGLIWGGVTFMWVSIGMAQFLIFLFCRTDMKDVLAYGGWVAGFTAILTTLTARYGLNLFVSITSFFTYFVLALMIFELIIRKKQPNKVISTIIFIFLSAIILLIAQPHIIAHAYTDISDYILRPLAIDRISITVAENQRPGFATWLSSFGIYFFWIFIAGTALLLYDLLKKKPADKNMIMIFASLFFAWFSARAAMRLFFFIYPFAAMMVSFIIVKASEAALNLRWSDDGFKKIMACLFAAIIIILSALSFYNFSRDSINEVRYAEVNGYYQVQWQQAMDWTRDSTPEDAVFAHWWDYGYWVQALGERATIVDGGNIYAYWDYLIGRHVLTGQNETEALEFLKTHNASYLLIDSTDIGKYSAFSSIGSDADYDRLSWINTFILDEKSSYETRNNTIAVFRGGLPFDEDMSWMGKRYPKEAAGIGIILLPINRTGAMQQPSAIFTYNNQQTEVPFNCVYFQGKKITFSDGINACFYILPSVTQSGINNLGGGLWLSGRLLNSLMVRMYILNDTENFSSFSLAHEQQSPVIEHLNSQYNLNLPDLILYNSALMGSIKIWKINYPGNIQIVPEYLNLTYPDISLWELKK